jgi:hypothetical protein
MASGQPQPLLLQVEVRTTSRHVRDRRANCSAVRTHGRDDGAVPLAAWVRAAAGAVAATRTPKTSAAMSTTSRGSATGARARSRTASTRPFANTRVRASYAHTQAPAHRRGAPRAGHERLLYTRTHNPRPTNEPRRAPDAGDRYVNASSRSAPPGKVYLYSKTVERAHTPKHLWEKMKVRARRRVRFV